MLARTLNLLLAAAIFACPYVCKLTASACAASTCCCHGHEQSQPESPDPSDHGSSKCHGCICGGAVLEDAAFDVHPDANWSMTPWSVELAVIQVPGAQITEFLTAPPPDGGANPGRTLRCLYMSFLC